MGWRSSCRARRRCPRTGHTSASTSAPRARRRSWPAPDGRPAAGYYARTGGDPIGAVQRLLKVMGPVAGLRGVATTGSGRAMIRQVFSADREVNEITAHARAAVFLHPDVDTIIEIGGQDSKFTRIRDGEVYFSTMNYVCAAGTGSFIEEQARRLGVSLSEFSDMALSGDSPVHE